MIGNLKKIVFSWGQIKPELKPFHVVFASDNGIVEEGIALRRQQNADDGVILARRQRLHELRPRLAVLPRRGKQHGFLDQIREDRQVAVAFRPGHLVDR